MQELDSVQKQATMIIRGNRDIYYHDILATLELQSLELHLGDLILFSPLINLFICKHLYV